MKLISLFTTIITITLCSASISLAAEQNEKNDLKLSKSVYGVFLKKIYSDNAKQGKENKTNELLSKVETKFQNITDDQFNKMLTLAKSKITEIDPSSEADKIMKNFKDEEIKSLNDKIPQKFLAVTTSEKDAFKLAMTSEFSNIKSRAQNSLNSLNRQTFLNKIKVIKAQNPNEIIKFIYFTHNIFSPAFGISMLKIGQESTGSQSMTMIFAGINLGLL